MKYGRVYLVGAGPGDRTLITLRAIELLKIADCVIYDGLVNPGLLRYAPQNAEFISVRKRTGPNPARQQNINELIVEKARRGKTVVRLKGGDPGMFGRAPEEAGFCADAGVQFEIVPGITAGLAAAEYCGIFLSDRDYSSQVLLVTGHEAAGKKESNVDFSLLAKFTGSIVFYMAVGNLPQIAEKLIKNGKSPDTPAAVVANATLPAQQFVKAPLSQIADRCRQSRIEAPAIVIIGAAADGDNRFNWFMDKPLFGRNIVITRDERGNAAFADKILARGGNPVEFNSIDIQDLTAGYKVQAVLETLGAFDWIVFTSANGVTFTFGALDKMRKDARHLKGAKVACIGTETAARLQEFGVKADFVPTVFTGVQLAEQLVRFAELKGKKIALLRSAAASGDLSNRLAEAGALVEDIPVYTIVARKNAPKDLIEQIKAGNIHWLTFTSPSTVRAFFPHISPDLIDAGGVKVASIGPVTSEQLGRLNVKVHAQAQPHTIDGLLDALTKEAE